MLTIGFHTHKTPKGFQDAWAKDLKLLEDEKNIQPASQIFTHNARNGQKLKLDIHAKGLQERFRWIIHAPHTHFGFWKTKNYSKIIDQMKVAAELKGNEGVVVHLPKDTPDQIADILKELQIELKKIHNCPPLLLENKVIKPGPESYELPSKLNELTKSLQQAHITNWNYCIDTQHLWATISPEDRQAGYQIETQQGMEKWLRELSPETKKKIKWIHFNGSETEASSHKDVHAIPIFGSPDTPDKIWGDLLMQQEIQESGWQYALEYHIESVENSSIYTLMKFAVAHNIGMIMEINRSNPIDIQRVSDLFKEVAARL